MSQSKSTPIVIDTANWQPKQFRFMPAKVNDKGGKSISLISTQSGRSLHISTPLLTTWGISDYTDKDTGVSDGKYNISFTFPNEQYGTPATKMFLEKMKEFEQAVLEAAVQNSETWWGEHLDLGIVKHTFFPILKYPKVTGTKKPDLTKMPNLNAKVPFYEAENKWNVEIYDTKGQLLFPNSNEELKPEHFVPRLSSAAAVIQCGGIWIGGKGWGVTWKLVQAVVKPKITESVFGKCHIQLSDEEQVAMETADPDAIDAPEAAAPAAELKAISTNVEDSDEEDEPTPGSAPAPALGSANANAPVAKTIVKKVPAAPAPAPAPAEEPAPAAQAPPAATAQAPPKKVIKKTVTKA
jgi:hypothetical protein